MKKNGVPASGLASLGGADLPMPEGGGSWVRQSDGTLTRAEGTAYDDSHLKAAQTPAEPALKED